MTKDRDKNFSEHSVLLSEIAQNILSNKDDVLAIPGIREIIALYLLIPYITHDQLDAGMKPNIPKLDLQDEFVNGITLGNLRNAISHSFVSVEESTEEHRGRIIIDDRALHERKVHDNLDRKTRAASIDIEKASKRLLELHKNVEDMV